MSRGGHTEPGVASHERDFSCYCLGALSLALPATRGISAVIALEPCKAFKKI